MTLPLKYLGQNTRLNVLLYTFQADIRKHIDNIGLGYILNAISYAPHILLMTAEVNESQFPKFSFQFIRHWSHNNTFKRKLFCRIPVFYNSHDLSRGYKTKVITLPP